MYTTPLITLISSISLNHHLYADDTQIFLSFHPSNLHSHITHETLCNRSVPGWLSILLLLSLLKLKFFLLDYNNNFLRYRTGLLSLLLQPTPLTTSALFLTNILPSLTKSPHCLNLATIISVNFTVSIRILTSKQPAPLQPPLSILNLTTVILCHNLPNCQLNRSNRFKTLLLALLSKLLIITPIL